MVRSRLRGYIFKIVRDHSISETIVIDSIGRAMERVTIDHPRHFVAWLHGIARNMAFHWVRDHKVSEKVRMSLPFRTARSAFAETISQEALALFDLEVAHLTKNQRRALLMRVIDHLSFEEIGVRMKIRKGAARALVHRARGRLAGWLGYMRAL